jgi:hypothetical protein
LDRTLHLRESPPRLLEERSAGVCQKDAALGAVEELYADFFLQLADLQTQGWLRYAQSLRGSAEMQLLGHRHEISQMPEFHVPIL